MARAKKKQKEEEIIQEAPEEAAPEETVAEEAAIGEILVVNEETIEIPAVSPEEEEGDMPITQEDARLVEAILFATSNALSVANIAERFPQERAKLIPDVLELLKEQYANRGVNLVQRNDRWAFRTATDLGDSLRLEKEQPKKFTRAAMETMAIIAYHQPVTRAEIENIRGVATSPGALDALMEAGWIKPGKRREVPGRPVTWLSTQSFLDHFGLESLADLPGMEELKAAGLLDKRPAIEAMPTADLFGEDENRQEEDPQEVTDEDLIGKTDGGDDAGDPYSEDDEEYEGDLYEEEDEDEEGDEDESDEDEEGDDDGDENDEDAESSGDEDYDDDDDLGDDDEDDGEDEDEDDEEEDRE